MGPIINPRKRGFSDDKSKKYLKEKRKESGVRPSKGLLQIPDICDIYVDIYVYTACAKEEDVGTCVRMDRTSRRRRRTEAYEKVGIGSTKKKKKISSNK